VVEKHHDYDSWLGTLRCFTECNTAVAHVKGDSRVRGTRVHLVDEGGDVLERGIGEESDR
jgi:hypothetical protein